MNSRQKGMRGVHKAVKYAKAKWPLAYVMVIYQPVRYATPAPFDMLILDLDALAKLVEVRHGKNWGVSKPQTKLLASLPGVVEKELWRFQRGQTVPEVRRWTGQEWRREEKA